MIRSRNRYLMSGRIIAQVVVIIMILKLWTFTLTATAEKVVGKLMEGNVQQLIIRFIRSPRYYNLQRGRSRCLCCNLPDNAPQLLRAGATPQPRHTNGSICCVPGRGCLPFQKEKLQMTIILLHLHNNVPLHLQTALFSYDFHFLEKSVTFPTI